MKSVTADGSLRSPTGGVEESYPTPHIHEQMTTSNYGYDTAYNFTHNNIMLEHNAMNNITPSRTWTRTTRSTEHTARRSLMRTVHIAPVAQVRLARVIPSMHVHLCVALWLFSLHPSPVFYFVPPFSFQPFQMFTSEFNERSRSNPLCDFRLGTVATSDHETAKEAKNWKIEGQKKKDYKERLKGILE